MNKVNLSTILSFLILTGCGSAEPFVTYPGATIYVTPTPSSLDPVQAQIDELVASENTYREGLGQAALTPGLGCILYTVTGGDRIQASITGHNTLTGITQVASFLYQGWFNQPDISITEGLNILPTALQSIYQNLYLLRCQGQIVVTETALYEFDTLTDDGSVFYLDGSKLIDNDNGHGAQDVFGQKYLRSGVHTFRLDYTQTGAGNEALVLKINGNLIDPRYYFH